MKKARVWLETHAIDVVFHDYKTAGIDRRTLERWVAAKGWETILNRAGTTFRKLPEADRLALTPERAVTLMLAQPSMIKRPVLEGDGTLIVGFRPEFYETLLSA
ncbi:hypothetical protein AA103196_1955 [Ameyamaea chiangmaiensis NBRC 103196]|nr:hypothetical protein AA103196_1955 [Ameyamaea chiangmaiensis NBRC 103196]